MAHQKINSWKGQGMMQKREAQDEVTSGMEKYSQQARMEGIRGIFTGKSFLIGEKKTQKM